MNHCSCIQPSQPCVQSGHGHLQTPRPWRSHLHHCCPERCHGSRSDHKPTPARCLSAHASRQLDDHQLQKAADPGASPADAGLHQQESQSREADGPELSTASSQAAPQLVQASASAPTVRLIGRQAARVARPAAPYAVIAVLLCTAGAFAASGWRRVVSRCRGCINCHGFGISRCSLCSGMGSVGWEGKWSHKEPCPLCLGRRFVSCPTCGGQFHRRMFNHNHNQKISADEAFAYVERGVQKLTD
ncbi:hypothetical protein WJX74_005597 [Apatococcus lobatus]|uniref:Uncharacterized protein n=1 Tax=Apatococcus lobatus TaxID=904363 RepID=A0AAW1RJ99_9CHLO